MKLRRHAKPDHEAASGAADTAAAGTEPATTLALRLLISSNADLPEQDFNAQKTAVPAARRWLEPAIDYSGIRRELPENNDEIFRSCRSGRP